jgi:hypothetical protein
VPRAASTAGAVPGLEPWQSEPKHLEARGIEPLDVVDRNEQRPLLRQHAERAERRRSDRPSADGAPGLAEQQRRLERAALHRREMRQHLGGRLPEQVVQPGERPRCLDPARPRRQHPVSALDRRLESGEPDSRLPDPRLAAKDGQIRCPARLVEQPKDRRQLLLATNNPPDCRRHASR